MAELKGACIFGQSGGPTSVINASAAGVFKEAMRHRCITEIYGLAYGIQGVLREEFYDMRKETPGALELLKTTPSSALGSVRYKLEDVHEGADYKRILEVFKKYNIRYFFYNGGNDSMDTCNKINGYLKEVKYDCSRIKFVDLKEVANVEKKIPKEWINKECNGVNRSFVEYALPLIQGESYPPAEGGLPRFAKLNKVPGNQRG